MLRTHRPATLADETFEQLPVGLLGPILAQVEEDCAYADPLAEDTDFAVMLSEEMSGTFADKDSRREKFCDMLSKEFFMPLNRATVGLGVTDGTAMLPVGVASAMAVNTEIKLEVGQGGGDPRLQNATHAAHNASLQYGSLGRVSYCPALLIELAGPNMSLSGFALGQYACCDQLSQMVSLLRPPKSEISIGAARAIFAIWRAWPALQVGGCLTLLRAGYFSMLSSLQRSMITAGNVSPSSQVAPWLLHNEELASDDLPLIFKSLASLGGFDGDGPV
jgi:hypothetical protein